MEIVKPNNFLAISSRAPVVLVWHNRGSRSFEYCALWEVTNQCLVLSEQKTIGLAIKTSAPSIQYNPLYQFWNDNVRSLVFVFSVFKVRMSKFFFQLVIVIHVFACAWYGLACPLDKCSNEINWVKKQGEMSCAYKKNTIDGVYFPKTFEDKNKHKKQRKEQHLLWDAVPSSVIKQKKVMHGHYTWMQFAIVWRKCKIIYHLLHADLGVRLSVDTTIKSNHFYSTTCNIYGVRST